MGSRTRIHVAAGVISDAAGRILVQRRDATANQGGLWEFPGGKLKGTEVALDALRRELNEEIGIEVENAEPLIRIEHDYPDLTVILDVWTITSYSGRPAPLEGQPLMWVAAEALSGLAMPAADRPIVDAILASRRPAP